MHKITLNMHKMVLLQMVPQSFLSRKFNGQKASLAVLRHNTRKFVMQVLIENFINVVMCFYKNKLTIGMQSFRPIAIHIQHN